MQLKSPQEWLGSTLNINQKFAIKIFYDSTWELIITDN